MSDQADGLRQLIRARSGATALAAPPTVAETTRPVARSLVLAELAELEAGADFLLVDAGSGLGPGIGMLGAASDQVVVVTTPEPTSVADAHAAIGRFRRPAGGPALRTVVNQAGSASEAADVLTRLSASSRQFLGAVVTPLGY